MNDDLEILEKALEEGNFDLLEEMLPALLAQNIPAAIRIRASFWGPDTPVEEGERLFREGIFKAAELGDLKAKYQVGVLYDTGEYGVSQDRKKASEIFRELAELHHAHSTWIYSCELIWGSENFPKDEAKGIELLEKASRLGSSEACITIARFYDEGLFGYEKNLEKRDEYRKRAHQLDETTHDPFK